MRRTFFATLCLTVLACTDPDGDGAGASVTDIAGATDAASGPGDSVPGEEATAGTDGAGTTGDSTEAGDATVDAQAADASGVDTQGSDASDGGSGGETADSTSDTPEDTAVPVLDCPTYCAAVQGACTGDHQQYASDEQCLQQCALLPLGTKWDAVGNTIGCRFTRANLAKESPAEHCPAAGFLGAGLCGEPCDAYCLLAASDCPGLHADCASECPGLYDIDCTWQSLSAGDCAVCEEPPTPGDTCAAPFDVGPLPYEGVGDTTGAADDLSYDGGPCGGEFGGSGGAAAPDQVWRLSPLEGQTVTIRLQGQAGYDPILYVLTDCSAPTDSCLAKKDAIGFQATEEIVLPAPSTPLYIVVDAANGQSTETGAYTLTIE